MNHSFVDTLLCLLLLLCRLFSKMKRLKTFQESVSQTEYFKRVYFLIQFIKPTLHALKSEHNRHTVSYLFGIY